MDVVVDSKLCLLDVIWCVLLHHFGVFCCCLVWCVLRIILFGVCGCCPLDVFDTIIVGAVCCCTLGVCVLLLSFLRVSWLFVGLKLLFRCV